MMLFVTLNSPILHISGLDAEGGHFPFYPEYYEILILLRDAMTISIR